MEMDRAATFTVDWPTPPQRTDTELENTQVWLTDLRARTDKLGFMVRVMDFRALAKNGKGASAAALAELMAKAPLEDPDEVSSKQFAVAGGAGVEIVAQENGLFTRSRGYGLPQLGYAVIVSSYDRRGISSAEAEKFFASFRPHP